MLTLQRLCLETIVNNFQMYHQLWILDKWNNEFHFLRKKYSLPIISRLYIKGNYKPEYMDFLINKYMKVLDSRWLKGSSWDAIVKKMEQMGSSLEKVQFFSNEEIDSKSCIYIEPLPWEKVLCYFPNIRIFAYVGCPNNNFICSLAMYCPKIETIDVTNSPVTIDGLKYLFSGENNKTPCPNLKELKIKGTNVSEEDVTLLLKNLHSLEKIKVSEWIVDKILYSLHRHDFECVDKVKPYNLTHLKFYELDREIIKVCALCPRLKSLSCLCSSDSLDLLFKLPEVLELKIRLIDVDDLTSLFYSISEILKMKGSKLTVLKLAAVPLSLSALAKYCPCLKVLKISRCIFEANDYESVPVFHNLEEVVFSRLGLAKSPTSESVCHLLLSSPNLKRVSFNCCEIIPATIGTNILKCCEQCKLVSIAFETCWIEPKLIENILLTCSSLESLTLIMDFYNNVIQYEDIKKLKSIAYKMPNKPHLWFEDLSQFSVITSKEMREECSRQYIAFLNSPEIAW